jgi:hypothetical protein
VSIARHGHSGQAYRTGFTLAERLRRTADRIDLVRMFGPIIVLGEAHLRRILKSSRQIQRTGSIKSHALLGGLHHRYVLLLRLQRPARYRISADLNCRAASRWLWPLRCCATARRSSLSRSSSNIVCDAISCPPPRNSWRV